MTTEATPQHLAIEFTLNGNRVDADVAPQTTAIDLLRDTFSLKGTKRSCDMQVCGACTILVDGAPVSSCTLRPRSSKSSRILFSPSCPRRART